MKCIIRIVVVFLFANAALAGVHVVYAHGTCFITSVNIGTISCTELMSSEDTLDDAVKIDFDFPIEVTTSQDSAILLQYKSNKIFVDPLNIVSLKSAPSIKMSDGKQFSENVSYRYKSKSLIETDDNAPLAVTFNKGRIVLPNSQTGFIVRVSCDYQFSNYYDYLLPVPLPDECELLRLRCNDYYIKIASIVVHDVETIKHSHFSHGVQINQESKRSICFSQRSIQTTQMGR